MTESEDQDPAPKCTPTWDVKDPLQQEVSRILGAFKYDIMGIIHLGRDGIMRSLTADRKVISAEAFTPELVEAFSRRLPSQAKNDPSVVIADGTKTPREKWFSPDEGILPSPLPREEIEKWRNASEEEKKRSRKLVEEGDKYVDMSGVLDG